MTVLIRFATAASFAALAACATGPFGGPPERVNFAADSALGAELGVREIDALYPAFVAAIEGGKKGEERPWTAGSATGSITPGQDLVGNLKPNPMTLLPVDPGLDLGYSFETELGLHALARNANLRSGPSEEARTLSVLSAGTAVDAVGKVVGEPWLLIAINGRVRGYVHESLAVKAPGTELDLAGGPIRRAYPCRAFDQTLVIFGRSDRWTGVACDRGDGWRLERPVGIS